MTSETEIIQCQGRRCDRKLRVPAGRNLIVTCPACKTSWHRPVEMLSSETVEHRRARPIVKAVVIALLLLGAVWNAAWLPAGLFVLALVAWLTCKHKAAAEPETIWQSLWKVLCGATASACGAAAIGFGLLLALVNVLNVYPSITPDRYPSWLLALETRLVQADSWFASANTKAMIAAIYVGLLALSVSGHFLLKRYDVEWRPVGTLSRWKQRLTKAVIVLQVVTLFTFFTQIPLDAHVAKLAEELRWRYGVARRAEQEFEAKRLVAEELGQAAKSAKPESKTNKADFVSKLELFRTQIQ